ncbi:MAG: MBL fold metallo-hydrolase [Patescibacteria group bacterium]
MDTKTHITDNPVEVIPVEHASGILVWGDKTIYMDPVGVSSLFAGKPTANVVFVTDIHQDHFSASTLEGLAGDAVIIAPQGVIDQLPQELVSRTRVMKNGETMQEQGFTITAVPMYNLPEAENANYHTPGRGNGYIIEKDNFRVYIAGDTAGTSEMRALKNIDIAFVPMNLPYTMSVDEAADAVLEFKPKIVYPYHFRQQDGLADMNRFKELVNTGDPSIEVIVADWYRAK